jgi:hypothetical protein
LDYFLFFSDLERNFKTKLSLTLNQIVCSFLRSTPMVFWPRYRLLHPVAWPPLVELNDSVKDLRLGLLLDLLGHQIRAAPPRPRP